MSDGRKHRAPGDNTLEFLRNLDGFEALPVESPELKRETDALVAEFLKALMSDDDHLDATGRLDYSPRPVGISLH